MAAEGQSMLAETRERVCKRLPGVWTVRRHGVTGIPTDARSFSVFPGFRLLTRFSLQQYVLPARVLPTFDASRLCVMDLARRPGAVGDQALRNGGLGHGLKQRQRGREPAQRQN